MIGVVYCVTNRANGKQYVGITTVSIRKRWSMHTWLAKNNREGCPVLCKAIRKNGAECFDVEQIDSASTLDELRAKEIEWIAHLGTKVPQGYNVCAGGVGSMGREQSESTRRLIAERQCAHWAKAGTREAKSIEVKAYYLAHPDQRVRAGEGAKRAWEDGKHKNLQSDAVRAKRAATTSDPEWKRRKAEATSAGRLAAIERKRAAGEPIYCKSENYRPSTAGVIYSAERCAEISARQAGKKRNDHANT